MMLLIFYMLIILMVITIIMFIPAAMNMQTNKLSEKISTFECGMNLEASSRKPFSLRFFLLMVLFLIFDIEITLLLAMPVMMPWTPQMIMFLTSFLMILTLGTLHEWALNWKL